MSVTMWWAVTVTGNHYFVDMIAGGFVVAISWLVVAWLSSDRVHRRTDSAARAIRKRFA